MFTFHGDPIEVEDTFDDWLDGPMTVVETSADGFRAIKGSNQSTTRLYNYEGRLVGRRDRPTAYWHRPDVVIPRKNAHAWLAQQQALKNLTSMMGDYADSAVFHQNMETSPEILHKLGLISDQQLNDLNLAALERRGTE